MRIALLVSVAIFLAGCEQTEPPPVTNEPAIPPVAARYLEAQAEGDWTTFCSLLAPREKKSLQKITQLSCEEALSGERGEALQGVARGARLAGTEKTSRGTRIDLVNPPGRIWVQGNRVFLREP